MITTRLISYMPLLVVLLVNNNNNNNNNNNTGTGVRVHAVKAYKGRSLAVSEREGTTSQPGHCIPGK